MIFADTVSGCFRSVDRVCVGVVRGGEALLDVIVKAGSEASGAKVSLGETILMALKAPNLDNLCFSPPC